jgi:hypothetical protein
MQEKAGFRERAVNKFIEVVLARLVDAEQLKVRIKTNLKQLARGEIDAIAIQMSGFLLQQNLRVADFRFDIGPAAVNVQSAMRRKIELLHPSDGLLHLTITEYQLSHLLQAELLGSDPRQDGQLEQLEQVNCELRADGAIAFHVKWLHAEELESGTCITIPWIEPNTNTVVLEQQNFEEKEPPASFVNAAIAQVSSILSLIDITNQGTTFQLQQLDIEAGKVTVQAAAHIEQFPSS